ncbi:YdcF family protein [Seongchinamella sediminis]|uniref:YdcF family protein n=1 Tax=Seongchinamella sediminis TaxID=2283635 RepID=A0A3L7E2A0_9GAMM|nr:YdcF family protein [Seongchinamella sediminis]RLQ22292.1 YdcF family protein [Seongchinamella sediminis]
MAWYGAGSRRVYRKPAISFPLTKLLSLLAYPLSLSLLLVLLAILLLRWQGLARALLLLAFGWLYACSTALFADVLMASLEDDYRPKAMSVMPAADAIVVLGGATRGDTHWSSMADLNTAADRITHGLALYKAGKAPLLLVSGGSTTGSRPEAEQLGDYLALMGLPASALLLERQSLDTRQNASYSRVVLEGRGVRSVLLVTSAYHMRRAVPLFQRAGFEVIPAPTDYQRLVGRPAVPRWLPTVDDLGRSTAAIKEYVGFIYYRARGWL